MITYTFDFERYKQALRLNAIIKNLLDPNIAEPKIEEPHIYNLLNNIIITGENL